MSSRVTETCRNLLSTLSFDFLVRENKGEGTINLIRLL